MARSAETTGSDGQDWRVVKCLSGHRILEFQVIFSGVLTAQYDDTVR